MKRTLPLVVAFLSLLPLRLKAGEGMWLLSLIKRLNYVDMQKEGLQLTPEEIYSVNHSSLKDAIISFNGYCTGEVVSPQGLIFTNHHCGYEAIAELSTEKHNYLRDGFWAYERSEERKPQSLFVSFFLRMEDVTDRVQKALQGDMSQAERDKAIRTVSQALIRENEAGGKYRVEVESFFKGNEFYLFVYEDYPDVRLVGTPPSSIGKFGGDTDNWEWPRHTGDFSIFRVYGDKEGNPAAYSAENVPLKPKHFLPINIAGTKPGDFSMIIGYPGYTQRYLPSWGIEQLINVSYPARVETSKSAMDIIKRYSEQNPKTRIDYAATYSQLANGWKNRIEMIRALTEHRTARKKRKLERRFARWAKKKANRARYGEALDKLRDYYTTTDDQALERSYLLGILYAGQMLRTVNSAAYFLRAYAKGSKKERASLKARVYPRLKKRYGKIDLSLEKALLAQQIALYARKVKPELQFSALREIQKQGPLSTYLEGAFDRSVLGSLAQIDTFLAKPDSAELDRDPLIALVKSLLEKRNQGSKSASSKIQEKRLGMRLFLSGLRKRYPHKKFYPDANFTPRLTYGEVKTLPLFKGKHNDAKKNYYTTLKGTVAKYKPGDEEFDLPARLIALYKAKDYGRYADADGSLHVDFLTDNDITGGNSGSPVIDARGDLIGLAFDGNAEAMSGDVQFEKRLQRTIVTDIRYVLFIIDKYAGATKLIKELKLVN